MAPKEDYTDIQTGIELKGFHTTLRNDSSGDYNLICASHKTDEGYLRGSSFWIWFCKETNEWFLGTWAPCYYLIPAPSRLIDICIECLLSSDCVLFELPESITNKYQLTVFPESDFNLLYMKRQGGAEETSSDP
jgi:hypothetical protein